MGQTKSIQKQGSHTEDTVGHMDAVLIAVEIAGIKQPATSMTYTSKTATVEVTRTVLGQDDGQETQER